MFQRTSNPWLIGGRAESVANMHLFAFSYAGGGASVFRMWNKFLPPWVDAYAVQLPGRETRFTEPRLTQFPIVIESIVNALRPSLNIPFVFFGHSLGGLLAFETARYLRYLGAPVPQHLFISGCDAPQANDHIVEYGNLSNAAFIQSVEKYGGMPEEILQNSELLDLFLPTLRADFSVLETYHYREEPALDCPITVFGGLDDLEVTQTKLAGWNIQTTKSFRMSMFPGDHFYLNSAQVALLTEITHDLRLFSKE